MPSGFRNVGSSNIRASGNQKPCRRLLRAKSAKPKESTLEAFVEPKEMSFEGLLGFFIDANRLKRAERIEDAELKLLRETDERVEAIIRDYHIIIDLQAKAILHDCADWSKMLPTKKICKHIGKRLLTIDREKATKILRKMYVQKQTWQFKPYAQQKRRMQAPALSVVYNVVEELIQDYMERKSMEKVVYKVPVAHFLVLLAIQALI